METGGVGELRWRRNGMCKVEPRRCSALISSRSLTQDQEYGGRKKDEKGHCGQVRGESQMTLHANSKTAAVVHLSTQHPGRFSLDLPLCSSPQHTHIPFGKLLLLHSNQTILMRHPVTLALLPDARDSLVPSLTIKVDIPKMALIGLR